MVRTTSMVARPGASMPAPLAMPPTVQPAPLGDRGLVHGVGGLDGDGGLLAAVRGQFGGGLLDAGQQPVHRQAACRSGRWRRPRSRRRCARRAPRRPSRRWRGCPGSPRGPVQALAPPELRTTALTAPPPEDLLRPQHGRGLDAVGGEDARGGAARAVVDDEGQVRVCRSP